MSDKPEEKKEAAPAEAAAPESKGVSTGMFFGVIGAMVLLMLGGVFAMWKFMVAPTLEKIQSPPAAVAVEGEASGSEHGGEAKKEGEKGAAKAEHGGEAKKEGEKGAAKAEHGGEAKKEGEKGGGGSSHSSGAGKGLGEFPITDVLVNVSGTRAGRVLKTSISFHATADVVQELESNQAKVRDLIIQILSRKTMDELTAPTAYGMIRTEIITNINALLTEGKVDSVSFTEFIIQ